MVRFPLKALFRAAPFTVAVAFLGCASVLLPAPAGKDGGGRFRGPDCDRAFDKQPLLREQGRMQVAQVTHKQTANAQIAATVCADRLSASSVDGPLVGFERMISKLHFSFDDRRFDQLAAARMVTLCAAAKTVNGSSASYCEAQPIALGMVQWYAARLDADRLRAALGEVDLAQATKDAFLARTLEDRERLVAAGAALDPRRRALYVETPDRIREERQRYFQSHASLYARFDALRQQARAAPAGAAQPELVKSLVALRGEYFAKCADASCKLDPLVTELTGELVLLHVLAQDAVGAELEFGLISEEHAAIRAYGPALWLAQRRAMEAEVENHRKHQHASAAGADVRVLEATFGSPPPIKVTPEAAWRPPLGFDDVGAAMMVFGARRSLSGFAGKVASIQRKGEEATIAFSDEVQVEDEVNCYPTNRIAAIEYSRHSDSARVRYESVCKPTGKKLVDRRKLPPVTIAASELGAIARGDVVQALAPAGGGQGGIVAVQRGGKVVQLRSHPLGR